MLNRRTFIGAGGAALASSVLSRALAADQLIIYELPSKYMNWEALAAAYAKTSNVQVTLDLKTGSSAALAAMKAEAQQPQTNGAFWSLDIAIEAKRAGVTIPYKPRGFDRIPAGRKDPDGYWWAMSSSNVVIGVNTDVLGKRGVPIPKTWNDLLRPEYKGLCGMMEPTYSGTSSTFLYGINFIVGGSKDDFSPGMRWLKAFGENGGQYRQETMAPRLASGDVGILIDAEGNTLLSKKQGAPVIAVAPPEGVVAVELGMSMAKGARDVDRTQKFFDWLLSDEAQAIIGASYFRPVMTSGLPADVAADLPVAKVISLDLDHESMVVTALKRAFTDIVTRGGDVDEGLKRFKSQIASAAGR